MVGDDANGALLAAGAYRQSRNCELAIARYELRSQVASTYARKYRCESVFHSTYAIIASSMFLPANSCPKIVTTGASEHEQ
jgi:hypothetical protein